MLDSKALIHVPRNIKFVAIASLGLAFLFAAYCTYYYVDLDNPKDPKYADWILVGMQLVHFSLSGLAIALVLFFSEREVGTKTLNKKTEQFLEEFLPDALARVSPNYTLRHEGSLVKKLGQSDIFGAAYELSRNQYSIKLWVGLNVSRLIVIYWVEQGQAGSDLQTNAEVKTPTFDSERLKELFQFTFGGAQKVGFSTYYESALSPKGQPIVSIWSSIKLAENLLLSPSDRLFWTQDIAMMTESFWRTAIRNGVSTCSEEPSPL